MLGVMLKRCLSPGGSALRALLDGLLTQLRRLQPGRATSRRRGTPAAASRAFAVSKPWQLQAASVVTGIAEVIFGASRAWQPDAWLGSSALPAETDNAADSTRVPGPLQELLQHIHTAYVVSVLIAQQERKPPPDPLQSREEAGRACQAYSNCERDPKDSSYGVACTGRRELEDLVELVEAELVAEPLWGVPTSAEALWEQATQQDAGSRGSPAVNPQVCCLLWTYSQPCGVFLFTAPCNLPKALGRSCAL